MVTMQWIEVNGEHQYAVELWVRKFPMENFRKFISIFLEIC